jgi:hypothetical protein
VSESDGEEIESFLGSVCSCRFNLDMAVGNNRRKLTVVLAKPNNVHYLFVFL